MPQFEYREVPFGTRFVRPGWQEPEFRREHPAEHAYHWPDCGHGTLHRNEIAADVGRDCFDPATSRGGGPAGLVFDHHLASFRKNGRRFPSATAAVLCNALEIREWVMELSSSTIWLVTHEDPDFDALCSLFLIRAIVEGEIRESDWERFKIRERCRTEDFTWWFDPVYDREHIEHVWPILLAAYASRLDQGERIDAPRARRLHAVMRAAMRRGRSKPEMVQPIFDAARRGMSRHQLSPLIDDVFVECSELAPELALLDADARKYRRDIRKARVALVGLRQGPKDKDFVEWFPEVDTPLLKDAESFQIDPVHLRRSDGVRAVDGIYVRDPESLLFEEWARTDFENSPMGRGFLFTAVGRSSAGTGSGANNQWQYEFRVDQERAGALHLYNVWAKLQLAEMKVRADVPEVDDPRYEKPRDDYGNRGGGRFPWYDGHDYRATFILPPADGGTYIAKLGHRSAPDMSDDPVARIVSEELEYAFFGDTGQCGPETSARLFDSSLEPGAKDEKPISVPISDAVGHPLQDDAFRFVMVPLQRDVLTHDIVASAIGKMVWPFLEPKGIASVPADFKERHLVIRPGYVAVWNRNGIGVAYGAEKENDKKVAEEIGDRLRELAEVIRDLPAVLNGAAAGSPRELLDNAEKLRARVLKLTVKAVKPEYLPFRRLLESRAVKDALREAEALALRRWQAEQSTHEEEQKARDNRLQAGLAGVAFVGLALAWFSVTRYDFADVAAKARLAWGGLLVCLMLAVIPVALVKWWHQIRSWPARARVMLWERGQTPSPDESVPPSKPEPDR